MNTEDIKKALECCSNPRLSSCNNCPYNNNGEFSCCDGEMCKDALNLITEQEKKIERLKDDYAKLQKLFAQYQMASDKEIKAQVKQAKIDVLNELKEKSYVNEYCREVVEVEKIDELIKELIKNDNTRND